MLRPIVLLKRGRQHERTERDQDRRKVIVFSTFADTIMDLHGRLTAELKTSTNIKLAAYKERLAPPIMGTYAAALAAGETGGVDQGGAARYRATGRPCSALSPRASVLAIPRAASPDALALDLADPVEAERPEQVGFRRSCRIRDVLRDRGFAPDEIEAVLAQNPDRFDNILERLSAVKAFADAGCSENWTLSIR